MKVYSNISSNSHKISLSPSSQKFNWLISFKPRICKNIIYLIFCTWELGNKLIHCNKFLLVFSFIFNFFLSQFCDSEEQCRWEMIIDKLLVKFRLMLTFVFLLFFSLRSWVEYTCCSNNRAMKTYGFLKAQIKLFF